MDKIKENQEEQQIFEKEGCKTSCYNGVVKWRKWKFYRNPWGASLDLGLEQNSGHIMMKHVNTWTYT